MVDNMLERLEEQIEITKGVIKEEEFRREYITNDTTLILQNQLIIMEFLKNSCQKPYKPHAM